jgi:hypothetical protein
MSAASYIFGIAVAVMILVVVIELLRRRLLRERHAIWWLVAGVAALVFGVFPPALNWVSQVLGIEIPTNLIFFLSIATLFLVGLQHSAELTRLESKTRTLAELVALQELRLKQLEDEGETRAGD